MKSDQGVLVSCFLDHQKRREKQTLVDLHERFQTERSRSHSFGCHDCPVQL